MLAILLERMGDVDYFILERSSSPKPLGKAFVAELLFLREESAFITRAALGLLTRLLHLFSVSRIRHVIDAQHPGPV